MRLLSVGDARARMLSGAGRLGVEAVSLSAAARRFLAEPVDATRDQPPFAASAMDGWAIRTADGVGRRRIIGESAAGRGFPGPVGAGEAVRIFTGAAIPSGADAVVIQEEVVREGPEVVIPHLTEARHIRSAGLDFRAGDRLLTAGVRLDPWRLSLAASAGRANVAVAIRPRVVILSTGDEVVAPGGEPGPFQIFNSGAVALASLVEAWGGEPVTLASVGDDEEATARAVAEGGGDLVVTLGGASVGDHDLVKPALRRLGLVLAVESVAVRPGKPTWFGSLADGRKVLGLPGNPASALVCAELFLRPLVRALLGAEPGPNTVSARAASPFPGNGDREQWLRARLTVSGDGCLWARAMRDQDSSLVAIFADADALVRRPPGAEPTAVGEPVETLVLDRLS
jgi:molybdopterin molybdotransferase